VKQLVQRLLADPAVRGVSEADPDARALHRRMILGKPLLADVYRTFYDEFVRVQPALPDGPRVEIGTGGGFLKDRVPGVLTSDLVPGPGLDLVCAAEALPFADESIAALFLLDVFHHVARPGRFLAEAERCLRRGGRLVMVEPAGTWWGRLVRRACHHEPFDAAADWDLPGGRDSNLALPWIVFTRDRRLLADRFPGLRLLRCEAHTPFRFLLSGGINYRALVPAGALPAVRLAERVAAPFNPLLGLHMTVDLVKAEVSPRPGFDFREADR
jgi:SAM-dependent methyltransferase